MYVILNLKFYDNIFGLFVLPCPAMSAQPPSSPEQ